jgi:hypothetical protein
MKRRYRHITILTVLVAAAAYWWYARPTEPTILAFRLGQTFEQVVNDSTYQALKRSNHPADAPGGGKFGAIWVTEPSVIIRFTDPKHGFMLPPTKFAALTFSENQAVTLATSPMLEPLPFNEAIVILENLQNQFKAGGWEPWEKDDSTWFDLTPEGKKRLHARMFEPGYMQWASLRVPEMYGMTFRLKCTEGCWTREPPYLFLIDIGIGNDYESKDAWRWRRPGAAAIDKSTE